MTKKNISILIALVVIVAAAVWWFFLRPPVTKAPESNNVSENVFDMNVDNTASISNDLNKVNISDPDFSDVDTDLNQL